MKMSKSTKEVRKIVVPMIKEGHKVGESVCYSTGNFEKEIFEAIGK